jgi:hypothetical protein
MGYSLKSKCAVDGDRIAYASSLEGREGRRNGAAEGGEETGEIHILV